MKSLRFASLTAGLLARKGEAHPASTTSYPEDMLVRNRQGWASPWHEATPPPPQADGPPPPQIFAPLEPEPALPAPALRAPSRSTPRAASADDACGHFSNCNTNDTPVAHDPLKRFHVSVRLRRGHFIRLKLASAQLHKPSQDIVADALTAWFATLDPELFGDCACVRDGT